MPPKAAKKGSAKKPNASGAAAGNRNWEAALTSAQFEEESWQACVSLVVGESPEDEELTQVLSLAVKKPIRKLFNLLTWDSTLEKIHELGNPKAKKPDDVPTFYEVTESAKVLLDAGEEIPCDLMAKILKFQLLQIKANDQQRREAEQEKTNTCPPSAGKDKGGAKVSDKKGKSPPSSVGPSKENTKLKRRDDFEPPKLIDDEPQDGPQHYILLLGFYQPHLVGQLDAIGVHVANVIKLCSEHPQTSEGQQQEQRPCEGNEQSPRASLALDAEAEVHGSVELAAQARKLDLFWSGVRAVLDSGPPNSRLNDVVQLSFTVPDLQPPLHTQDPEAELETGSQIFEGVANLIYDCLDWRRQHQHYLNNIKLISVPAVVGFDPQPVEVVPTPLPLTPRSKKKLVREETPPETQQPPLSTEVDMRYYCDLLDMIPPEACSVPLIMHCMLEQVLISTEQSLSTLSCIAEEPKSPNSLGLDYQLVSFMLQSFLPLVHTNAERSQMLNSLLATTQNEEHKKRLEEKFGAEETQNKSEQPLVIRHHNEIALRLRDISAVQGFDPAEVELSVTRRSSVWELIQSVARPRDSNSCWMAIKQQLQHYCTDDVVSWPEVESLIHQSVFESMPLTRPNQNGVLKNASGPLGTLDPAEQQTPTIIPWDNPLSYAKQQLDNLRTKGPTFLTEDPVNTEISGRVCCQLNLHDIQSCRLRSLFDWHYTEHHSASIFPQVLQLASEEYRYLDTFRGSHNNILYIFCHNPMSPYHQCKEFWDVALHTDVKFRKYLEHVADSISDWTKEEELKREAMLLRDLSPAESPKDEATDSAEEEDALEPVIRKGSLKAWKVEQEQLKEEEMSKKSKKENTPKNKQQKEEPMLTDDKKSKTLSSGKKTRAETAASSTKTPTESITNTAHPAEENKELHLMEEPFNGFTGYSMDRRLIHVSGRCQYLFPSDGGQITVENVSYVEGSSLMKVAVKKDGHNFYTHINQVVVEPANPLPQPQDKETKVSEPVEMKRVKQGSLSAVLDNGIHLSYSFYGPTGEYRVSPQETARGAPETSTVVPIPHSSSTHRSRVTDLDSIPSKTHSPAGHTRPPESQVPRMNMDELKNTSKVCDGQPALISSPFNSLHLSVPNGLLLQFLREDSQGVSSEEQGMLVKQGFPLHGRGAVGQLQDPSLSKELSRIVTYQGAVIRNMRDGSTEVLFADGSVSFSQDSGPVWVPDSEVEEEDPSQESEDNKKEQSLEKELDNQRGCWLTTTPSGARIHTVGTTHKHIPTTTLLAFKATDPITKEVMLSREDLVVSVRNPDGSISVEHADGTRITSLYQDRPPSTPQHILLHTGEQPESVTPKSTFKCACGCTECVCVTRCADSINENVHFQDTGDKEGAGLACSEFRERELVCDERESTIYKSGEESVFAAETVDVNAKSSACESDKGSVSTKERVVLVEKEGCATVVMYPEQHMAHVFLADGTVVTGNNQGAYQVFPSSEGLLHIQSDGKCVYSSDPLVTPSPNGCTPTNQPGSYTMSHTDIVACDITDPDGTHFQVMEDGQLSVLNCSPAPSTLKQDEEETEEDEEDREMAKMNVKQREHCHRLFLVHEDGSGTELLSSETVEELLYQAYSDPAIALLKEPLPDTQDEFGITILKPSHQSVWSQWLLGKQNPDITPPNLRNRSWQDFPRIEKKSPGPPFGADMGRGLTLKDSSGGSAAQRQPLRSCPKVLEMRELYQHRPFTTIFKNTVDTRLKEYIESLMEREQRSEEMKVKDPRTEVESGHASDLLNLVLSFAEKEEAAQIFDKRTSVNIANLYSQGVGDPIEQSDVSEDTATVASDSFTHGKESKWNERLTQYRQEMCEEQACKEALRKKNIVPFFHLENIPLYQNLLHDMPDMRCLSMDLPPIPKSGSTEAFLKDAPQEKTPRPLNPTPSQSASHAGGSDRKLEKRPTNPTPQTAGESSLRRSSGQCKSIQVDVTGKPRRTKVRLPTSILSSKPCSVPNQQFLSVEEPVRRKCRTVSLTDPSVIARGFQLLPSSVDFGTLQEGTSSAITVVMKNVGVDTCRFRVKQPPPATGLRVIYNPGPVAAGLHVELLVQLFAMCTVQAGEVEPKKYISQEITIHTETDILYLPVTATILPERLYDIWLKDHIGTHNKKGSRVRGSRTYPQTTRIPSDQSFSKRGTS
ncbi:LOW QUALITY PROTEIN: sperm-associated antigen 17 [Anoplopoma fimbria]|uniref:LOW QUALITY PROTEIN: sperm-associated antigen 17 n=1 Tax=Anoplopoma fimbria TaxID=229290 RepID=UPI0023EB8C9A|nr:LOW QUALITY PROTEIN: sperm-associated antigen 17 [Anoplopoma fimbria]